MVTFGTATASFETDMISNHICWDGCCFSNQNRYKFLFESNLFRHLPRKTCFNLPVIRVMAIPKRRIVVLRVILQPKAEKVLKILYIQTKFSIFLSTFEKKNCKKEFVTSKFVRKKKDWLKIQKRMQAYQRGFQNRLIKCPCLFCFILKNK